MPQISKRGVALIAKWEGFFPRAYRDPVGVVTIGYGSINNPQLGIRVKMGDTITKEKAVEWKMLEITQMEKQIARLVKVPLTQHQWDALVSFTYNCGIGNFSRSTLLKKLNKGDYNAIPAELMKWTLARRRSDNKYIRLQGLVNRRTDEARMWRNEPISEIPPAVINTAPRVDMRADEPTVKIPAVKEVPKAAKEVGFWGTITAFFASVYAMLPMPSALPSEQQLIAYGALAGSAVVGYLLGRLHAYLKS